MNSVKQNWIVFTNAAAERKYFTALDAEELISNLDEQELIIEDHLRRCAMLKQQLKCIPRLAVNQDKVRMRRAMLKEAKAAILKHAALRSQFADDLCRLYVAQQRRRGWKESCAFLRALSKQALQEVIARVNKLKCLCG